MLAIKQVKFVVFLCFIRTTETRPDLAILNSVDISGKGLKSGAQVPFTMS